MPDFLVYLIYGGGVIGISLGVFTYLRPFLRSWRGLFPSIAEHDSDVRMMEDALSGVYHRTRDEDKEAFRSFFTQDPAPERSSMYSRSVGASPRSLLRDNFQDEAEDAELEEQEPVIRPPIRTISVAPQEAAPQFVPFQTNSPADAPAPEEALIEEEEEEDLLAGLVDPLADPLAEESGDAIDNDLLSLFEEEQEVHSVPAAVRKAIPDVTIDALLSDARQIWSLLGNEPPAAEDAA